MTLDKLKELHASGKATWADVNAALVEFRDVLTARLNDEAAKLVPEYQAKLGAKDAEMDKLRKEHDTILKSTHDAQAAELIQARAEKDAKIAKLRGEYDVAEKALGAQAAAELTQQAAQARAAQDAALAALRAEHAAALKALTDPPPDEEARPR